MERKGEIVLISEKSTFKWHLPWVSVTSGLPPDDTYVQLNALTEDMSNTGKNPNTTQPLVYGPKGYMFTINNQTFKAVDRVDRVPFSDPLGVEILEILAQVRLSI